MTTKRLAPIQGGQEIVSAQILDRVRAAIKRLVVSLALWGLLPYRLADWVVRYLRLRDA